MEILEKDTFVHSIVALRKKKNITQQQLSSLSGISQPVIARMEKGKTDPQLSTIAKVLKCLGAKLVIKEENDMDYFITLEKEVMSEVAASVEATIINYEVKHNIDNDNDPIEILHTMVHTLKESLTENDYTMDDLKLIQAKFEFARDYMNEVKKVDE